MGGCAEMHIEGTLGHRERCWLCVEVCVSVHWEVHGWKVGGGVWR